jgi:hypothetical protein
VEQLRERIRTHTFESDEVVKEMREPVTEETKD